MRDEDKTKEQLIKELAELRENVSLLKSNGIDIEKVNGEINAALKEKELLLRELYHRTKNNMQVIRSILVLQAAYTQNEEVKKIVSEIEYRIQAMAMVHQMLYQSKSLSNIDLREYLCNLGYYIMQGHGISTKQVSLLFDMENMAVLIDTAIPLGLIFNELVTNAFRHAFPGNLEGEIKVRVIKTDDNFIEIFFSDNGVGVPPEFDFRTQNSLGIQTIISICEHQLRGTIDFESGKGTMYHIRFKDSFSTARV